MLWTPALVGLWLLAATVWTVARLSVAAGVDKPDNGHNDADEPADAMSAKYEPGMTIHGIAYHAPMVDVLAAMYELGGAGTRDEIEKRSGHSHLNLFNALNARGFASPPHKTERRWRLTPAGTALAAEIFERLDKWGAMVKKSDGTHQMIRGDTWQLPDRPTIPTSPSLLSTRTSYIG